MTFPAVPASDEHNKHALTLWTRQVALILPAELTDVWLNGFPPFHTITDEAAARAAILEQFAERLAMIPTGRCTPIVKAKRPWWERARDAVVRGMVAQSESQMWRRGR